MLKIEKQNNEYNAYTFRINASEGLFLITFAGNLDLYFSYFDADRFEKELHSFIVDKDNYFLYKCFDFLYDSIESEKPFKDGNSDFLGTVYSLEHMYSPLLKDGIIEWHSDDGDYDEAAILYIEKLFDAYKISIKNGMISDMNWKTSSVRIRNSGSRYDPYNVPFMVFIINFVLIILKMNKLLWMNI